MTSRQRVAVVLHEPELGGATRSLLQVVPLLEQQGWSFVFWVPGRGPAERELSGQGRDVGTAERRLRFSVSSLREPPGPARRLASVPGYLRSWRAWLRAQEADLVHANSLLALPEIATRRRGGPPVVLHTHEVLPGGMKGAVAGRLAARADVVVAVSQAAAGPLRARGIDPEVVYEAVPEPPPAAAVRHGDGRLVVGTLGTVSRRKGSELFLAAAERARAGRDLELRLVGAPVVGGGRPWAEAVLQAARRAGVEHRVGVDAFAELAEWDVFVLPSRMDPCPLAVLEAMAMGVPVVATRVGGIPEQLGEDAGLLVVPEDVDGIAAAIGRLVDSPELRVRLGDAARGRVRRMFSLERQAEGLERAYRRALGV